MPQTPSQSGSQKSVKKLRSACDICHQSKVKCTGGQPCDACRRLGISCLFSQSNRLGRPKGTLNKKTLSRIQSYQEEIERRFSARVLESGHEYRQESSNGSSNSNSSSSNTTSKAASIAPTSLPTPVSQGMTMDNETGATQLTSGTDNFWTLTQPFGQNASGNRNEYGGSAGDDLFAFDIAFDKRSNFDSASPQNVAPSSYISEAEENWQLAATGGILDLKTFSDSGDSSSAISPEYSCKCVHTFLQLMCHLHIRKARRSSVSVDHVLVAAKRTQDALDKFLRCQSCRSQRTDDREHLYEMLNMASTCSRLVIRLLRDANAASSAQIPSSPATSGSSLSGMSVENVRHSIGVYQASSEETLLVSRLLMSRSLDSLSTSLESLKGFACSLSDEEKAKTNPAHVMIDRSLSSSVGGSTHSGQAPGQIVHLEAAFANCQAELGTLKQSL